jgi:hypothetical protein
MAAKDSRSRLTATRPTGPQTCDEHVAYRIRPVGTAMSHPELNISCTMEMKDTKGNRLISLLC